MKLSQILNSVIWSQKIKLIVILQDANVFKLFIDSRHAEINDKINQKINEKKEFPDYLDVLGWVTEANTEAKLELKQAALEQLARESFEEIGRDLKQRRKRDTESMFDMLIQSEEDASVYTDKDLDVKLNENKKIANEKSEKVFVVVVSTFICQVKVYQIICCPSHIYR